MSFFSWVFNFLIWNDFSKSLWVSLPAISSYLSLWAAFAYILGFFILVFLSYRTFLVSLSFFLFLILGTIYLFGLPSYIFFIGAMLGVGIMIGIWNIIKNIFLSLEIKKTWWKDTTINAFASIALIVSMLLWSIGGNILFTYWWRETYELLLLILGILIVLSFWLIYPKQNKENKNIYKPLLLWENLKKYRSIILSSCFVWALMSALSQIFVEYSKSILLIDPFRSSFLLLSGAFGVIGGNIFSSVFPLPRITFLSLATLLWWGFFLVNQAFVSNYQWLLVFCFLLSFVFWIISNLIDARFLDMISQDSQKDFFSSLYWFSLSISIFAGTFLLELLTRFLWLQFTLYLIAFVVCWFTALLVFSKKYKLIFK